MQPSKNTTKTPPTAPQTRPDPHDSTPSMSIPDTRVVPPANSRAATNNSRTATGNRPENLSGQFDQAASHAFDTSGDVHRHQQQHQASYDKPQDTQPPLLDLRSQGRAFIDHQRAQARYHDVSESLSETISSLYETDRFEFTDSHLITYFKQANIPDSSISPFFSTSALAPLLMKCRPQFSATIKAILDDIKELRSTTLERQLISLSTAIGSEWQTSPPTTIKIAIFYLVDNEKLTDDSFMGLEGKTSLAGRITSFLERYYQLDTTDDRMIEVFKKCCRTGEHTLSSLQGQSISTLPGYINLIPERDMFIEMETATKYVNLWNDLWECLKLELCAGEEWIPDIDLALRRRIINNNKTHPLRQQYTTQLEPVRNWLERELRANQTAEQFEKQLGRSCGAVLDTVTRIGVAVDALHPCLLQPLDLAMIASGINSIPVPRHIPELGINEPDRRLPDVDWAGFEKLLHASYKVYMSSLSRPT